MRALFFLALLPGLALAQGYLPAAMHPSSISTSEPTWTSTQTDGGAAFVAPTGQRVCLNGASCTQYVQSDGGTIGLVGAEVDVPNGFTDSQKVNPGLMITPLSVVAQAGSGQRASGVAHNGARVYFGESGNLYCYSDGTGVICLSGWKVPVVETDSVGAATASRDYVDVFNPAIFPVSSLGTCDGQSGVTHIPEGTLKVRSGASLSAQSRICACVSDGGGAPAWTWINLGCPNTAGTNSTCPACP